MKIKQLSAALMLSLATFTANAQISKGDFLVGTSISNLTLGIGGGNGHFSAAIAPNAGYFLADKFVVGAMPSIGISQYGFDEGELNFHYGLGLYSRYYFGKASLTDAKAWQKGRVFVEIIGTAAKTNKSTITSFNYSGSVGYAYFIVPTVALEAKLAYHGTNLSREYREYFNYSVLNLGFGFQIHLSGKKK